MRYSLSCIRCSLSYASYSLSCMSFSPGLSRVSYSPSCVRAIAYWYSLELLHEL